LGHTAPIGMGQALVRRRRLSLNVDGLKAAYEKAIGRPTCNSTINNVALQGWRKLLLRPFHSRCDWRSGLATTLQVYPFLSLAGR
jgi:hypothetical protein